MQADPRVTATIETVFAADSWNRRVSLIRQIPEEFGIARHREVYGAIAQAVYVADLAPDFAYIHWRDEYELSAITRAYQKAFDLTQGFKYTTVDMLEHVVATEPETLRIFRLFLGFTTQEFAASSSITAAQIDARPLSNGLVKSLEAGRRARGLSARIAAMVIDQTMRGELFPPGPGEVRSKINKPDTMSGWTTIRQYAAENVPFSVFLHQRHYGGAFRQLLDSTSGRRGNLLEDAVKELFHLRNIGFIRTGPSTRMRIADKFGLTVVPAPDFVIHDRSETLRAILECKQANDGGTARDKASRFASLRSEAVRLGGVPVFAVLAGLGWRRTGDTLGPVVRDTDGRVFTVKTLESMMTVDPFPALVAEAAQ